MFKRYLRNRRIRKQTRPTNVVAGSSSLQALEDIGPIDDSSSQIVYLEPWTSVPLIGGTGHENGLASEGTGNSNIGESKSAERPRDTEGFGPLKLVLGSILATCTNRQEAVAVGNKIEGLISHVVLLDKCFLLRPRNAADLRRRDELLHKCKDIKEQLWSLAVMPELRTEEIYEILEELRETMFHYGMARQEEVQTQQLYEIDPAEVTVLNNFRRALGAEYRHGNRNRCLKGTRGTVLDAIERWTGSFDELPVYWLNGLPGTGKTAIARTIAERTFAEGQLGASFFCSRDFEDRSNLQLILPTLAVQLARNYPEFRSIFVRLVRADVGIAYESLYGQMRKLIVRPLKESGISTIIVIDALDECKDEEPASEILSVLGQFLSEIPQVKFLITGRPEPHIREGFRLPLLAEATDVCVLHDVEPSQVDNDIRLFFTHEFSEPLRPRRGLDGGLTREQLDLLCRQAAGLFANAVATVKFIDTRGTDPVERMNLLSQSPEGKGREPDQHYPSSDGLVGADTVAGAGPYNDKTQHITHPAPDSSVPVDSDTPAWKHLIGHALLPHEVISLIETVFTSKDELKAIFDLRGTEAQTLINAIHEAMDLPDLSPSFRGKCLSALCRICGRQALLPRSLQIPICYNQSHTPLYRGGFADVWKGEYQGRHVAVKVLRIYSTSDIGKITSSARTWNALCHPNVLPLLGITMDNNLFAMVSEWMGNGNINEFIKAHRDANPFELLKEVTSGLIYIHSQAMIHGDLKGANILIDQDRTARLADFGLLTIVSDPTIFTTSSSASTGGTIRWMSPELLHPELFGLDHGRPTEESDCYALGMVIYEVIAGQPPFTSWKDHIVMLKVTAGERPGRPEGVKGTWFTDDLWKILGLCWGADAQSRPSIEAVGGCLEQVSSAWKPSPLRVNEGVDRDENDVDLAFLTTLVTQDP